MKMILKKAFYALTILALFSHLSFGQKHKHGKGGAMQPLINYSGKVISFTPNPDKIYDRLQININGETVVVKFPKHLGKQIMATAKPGSTITVSGFMDYSPIGIAEVHMVSLTSGTTVIYDIRLPKPLPEEEKLVNVQSTIVDFKRDLSGMIDGVYLTDKTILHFPKHTSYQLVAMMKKGDNIQATGYLKKEQDGVAFAETVRLVKAETITVNGTAYLIR